MTHGLILLEDLGMQYAKETSKYKLRSGLYKCFCGNEFKAISTSVKRGHTKSCGCLRGINHKATSHRLYNVWRQMIARCNNSNHKAYKYYGARGITVCDRWLDVATFISDMYPNYKEGLSIDRIDNDKGYSLDNCRWATKSTQQRNTRKIMNTNKSGFRGVNFNKKSNKWFAKIKINKKQIYLGSFTNLIEAAKAYDNYVINNGLEHTLNFKSNNM